MTKERILFVGQHPEGYSGNGNMLHECLYQVDYDKYSVCVFAVGDPAIESMSDPFDIERPYTLISAQEQNDMWGKGKLVRLIQSLDFDQLIFVGLDIWRYADAFEHIIHLRTQKKFTWKVIVPYDLQHVRDDWLDWLSKPDHVFVYSYYGYNMLRPHLSNVSYFRPALRNKGLYSIETDRAEVRKQVFPHVNEDTTIFGLIVANQLRKNILRTVEGFARACRVRKEEIGKEDMLLYVHIDTVKGVFDLEEIVQSCQMSQGTMMHNNGRKIAPVQMAMMYRTFDAHLLYSMQEGLSWTVIEAQLSGVPSLVSDTTAHRDYTQDPLSAVYGCYPDNEDMLGLMTKTGPAYIRAKSCSSRAIEDHILTFMNEDEEERHLMRDKASLFGNKWCDECDHISKVLEQEVYKEDSMGEEI